MSTRFAGDKDGFQVKFADGTVEIWNQGTLIASWTTSAATLGVGSADLTGPANEHLELKTETDTKNVRINSRSYTQTSGDASGAQIKPNQSADGTAGISGLEVSPRFAAGIGGSNLVAIKADPLLKAGSGNLSGSVVAVQANLDFGVSGTRTITGDVSAFESFLAIPSTYTYSAHVSFLRVRTVNIKAWDAFLNLDDSSVGLVDLTGGTYSTAQGFLKVFIGDTAYRIPIYTGVD